MAKKIRLTNLRTGEVIETDDERIIVPDGFTVSVPLFMMDALQHTVAADAAARGLAHRSGYQSASSSLVNDGQRAAVTDERTAAYLERSQWLADTWRTPPSQPVSDADKQTNDVTLDREAAYEAHLAWLRNAWRTA